MAKSYYKTIDGKQYDRDMLRVAEKATPPKAKSGKPVIDLALATKLFKALADGKEYTDIEKKTMRLIRDEYTFTEEADSYIRTEVRRFAAKHAKRKPSNKTTVAIPESESPNNNYDLEDESTNEIKDGDANDRSDDSSKEIESLNQEYYPPKDEPIIEDDKSGFREFVEDRNIRRDEKKERRKKLMIRAVLILIFLLFLLGLGWMVCRPKTQSEQPQETNAPSSNPTPISNSTPISDPTPSSKIAPDTTENSQPAPVIHEEGPGTEEFSSEPSTAAPVKKRPHDANNQKSAIRYINSLEVPFVRNQEDITPEGRSALDELADVLLKHSNLVVRVEGHTCWIGSMDSNQTLSEKRARVVYDYLITKSIPASQLDYRGYGEKTPVASNRTKEGRMQNRRVEFTVLRLQ